ncbi:MAG: RNA-binding domain-containing protein, partial [Candidatus Sericytochromatia bacterium]
MRSLEALLEGQEDRDLEVKAAQGQDGQGELPRDFWGTYSAMANTWGGTILLGVREKPDRTFRVVGVQRPEKVVKSLWDNLNNRKQISHNLLYERHVRVEEVEGKSVIVIEVPRASREERPVYVGSNPLTGSYRRSGEGDYRLSEAAVKGLLADARDSLDATIIKGYTLADLDADTLRAYRHLFAASKPNHPWLNEDDRGLLLKLGGWRRDRETGEEGLTLAGLLMFGQLHTILERVDTYLLDYREVNRPVGGKKWEDRLTTDGTWSGNLFDFFLKVQARLTSDLKVPYQVVQGHKRIDDTPIHEALREALVNTLIHADYHGRIGILVTKSPDGFYFRNPGELRLPAEEARIGGTSDCRNRALQKMFQMIGEGEQGGSGVNKIYAAWASQHWRVPALQTTLTEDPAHTKTELRLSTDSLLPADVVDELEAALHVRFDSLNELERLALVTAQVEGGLTHGRLAEMSSAHPHDLSKVLHNLKRRGYLSSNDGWPRRYRISLGAARADQRPQPQEQLPLFPDSGPDALAPDLNTKSSGPTVPTPDKEAVKAPMFEELLQVRSQQRPRKQLMETVILRLCR